MTIIRLAFAVAAGRTRALAATTVVFAAMIGFTQAQTPAATAFYTNRQINLLVGSDPGSGYDTYGRLVAMYMEKHLSPGARIVVKTMPGAGGIVATNYLAKVADKDGSNFAIVQREAPLDPLMAGSETIAQFDPLKLTWLGSPNQEIGMVYMSTKTGAKSIEEARTREFKIAASGATSGPAVYSRILNTLLGTKFKAILGYVGSGDALLAIQNGEADGRVVSGWAGPERAKATAWVEAGEARLLMQIAAKKSADYPNLPHVMDFAKDDNDRRVMEFLFTGQSVGNPFFAAPEIPPDRADILKSAFMNAVRDPGFAEDAKKQQLVVGPISGDQVLEIMRRAYSTPPEIRQRALEIYNSARQ